MKEKSPCDLRERTGQQLLLPKASQSTASLPKARGWAENGSLAAWVRAAVLSKGTRTAPSGCRDISTEWLGMGGGPGILPKARNPLPLPLHKGCTTTGGTGCPSQTSSQLACQQLTAVRVGIQEKKLPLPSAKAGDIWAGRMERQGTAPQARTIVQHLLFQRTLARPAPAARGCLLAAPISLCKALSPPLPRPRGRAAPHREGG